MKKILIIPERGNLDRDIELANKYSLGFEYNDFFLPTVLDNDKVINEIVDIYNQNNKNIDYTTSHGAFFDVIPFSVDSKIKEISEYRIKQSIEVAQRVGAKSVVFHTNYNPFFKAKGYIDEWLIQNEEFWGTLLNKYSDINLYLENMFDATPDIMAELASRLEKYKNFGICLDYAHASITNIPAKEWAKVLGKYVKHIHLNDNDLVSDLHMAWGEGKIDHNGFYEMYDKYMKGATVLVENSCYDDKVKAINRLVADGFMDKR